MWEYIYHHCNTFDDKGNATAAEGSVEHKTIPQPELINWELDSFVDQIEKAKSDWDELVS